MGETENREGPAVESSAHPGDGDAASDELLSRIELIESQPLAHRARMFEQVHDELLAELQRGDHGGS